MGISYNDAQTMPAGLADSLLEFHSEVKEYEAYQMEMQTKQMKR